MFDAVDTVEARLDVTTPMVRTLKVNREKMLAACRLGFLLATDAADAFARRGFPFAKPTASWPRPSITPLRRDLWRPFCSPSGGSSLSQSGPWILETLSLEKAVAARRSLGGTAPVEVKRQTQSLRRRMGMRQ